ncbi:putative RDD family membrane protein YckC [Actinomadura cellulosilytica]|uniref:Putative RDD family membrane protein YckC n=1 Tax=Thermomonospora cellulosilytica TaxID=1411118 RepID=A0A7W3MTZ2_9ACTN|nr:putative RDD family membrane protein YckC [Thermomonospora cellulosilytica]
MHHHHYGPQHGVLAEWGSRVGAYIIDGLIIGVPAGVLYVIGFICLGAGAGDPYTGEGGSGGLVALAFLFWGLSFIVSVVGGLWLVYQEGTTGQTIGKRQMGIKLIGSHSGQPIGFGSAFVRKIAHILDGIPCYIGYLWPLFDDKKQTFADKVMSTLVVRV